MRQQTLLCNTAQKCTVLFWSVGTTDAGDSGLCWIKNRLKLQKKIYWNILFLHFELTHSEFETRKVKSFTVDLQFVSTWIEYNINRLYFENKFIFVGTTYYCALWLLLGCTKMLYSCYFGNVFYCLSENLNYAGSKFIHDLAIWLLFFQLGR